MGDLTVNFSRHEFACRCGCGADDIHADLVNGLQKIRDLTGPIVITSGVRCKQYNIVISGRSDSSHLRGLAADIKCSSSGGRFDLVHCALLTGFRRIGVGRDFIHVDIDDDKDQDVMWIYP